jgi:hypothetical protein
MSAEEVDEFGLLSALMLHSIDEDDANDDELLS